MLAFLLSLIALSNGTATVTTTVNVYTTATCDSGAEVADGSDAACVACPSPATSGETCAATSNACGTVTTVEETDCSGTTDSSDCTDTGNGTTYLGTTITCVVAPTPATPSPVPESTPAPVAPAPATPAPIPDTTPAPVAPAPEPEPETTGTPTAAPTSNALGFSTAIAFFVALHNML